MKRSREQFILEARQVHGWKYDYSKVEYVNNNTKVCIVCPEHGEFWQTPHNHLAKHGCRECSNKATSDRNSLSKHEFLSRANQIHNNRFIYTNIDTYKNKSSIIEFTDTLTGKKYKQVASSHLDGHTPFGKTWDTRRERFNENFLTKIHEKYDGIYDLSKIKYVNNKTKICVVCKQHGEFYVHPETFLNGKTKCPKCRKIDNENYNLSIECVTKKLEKYDNIVEVLSVSKNNKNILVTYRCSNDGIQTCSLNYLLRNGCKKCKENNKAKKIVDNFIEKARKIHGNKYDYSKVEYSSGKSKVCIICPEHGEFWQSRENHLKGEKCKECAKNDRNFKNTKTKEEFITNAIKIWGNKFDYSMVEYVDAKTKVCIVCPIHGEFWQTPSNHLSGYDCYECSKSQNTKEIKLRDLLKNDFRGEIIEYQAHLSWLGRQTFDIYFPKYNVAVEYQGIQHFQPVSLFGGKDSFEYMRGLDTQKYNKCVENNCTILYFSFIKQNIQDFPYEVIFDYNELKEKIKKIIEDFNNK